ncbi:hypothetical protein HGM15179_019888, partial [Zosterops borbonicus]
RFFPKESVPGNPKESKGIPGNPKESQGIPKNPKESQGIPGNPKESQGIQRNPRESPDFQRNPKESQRIQRNPKESQGIPGNPKESQGIPGNLKGIPKNTKESQGFLLSVSDPGGFGGTKIGATTFEAAKLVGHLKITRLDLNGRFDGKHQDAAAYSGIKKNPPVHLLEKEKVIPIQLKSLKNLKGLMERGTLMTMQRCGQG